jgi:EmrB/QacA subfamily drug resistance transporter
MQVVFRMRGRDTWVLLATIVGSSLAFIDGAVVALALPEIQREFHARAADVAWIVELYTLVLGSLMLLGGALADRYGRKRAFVTGTILFALASAGCAFAQSMLVLQLLRVVQALGGTLLVPSSLAIVSEHFTGDRRGRAFAAWSAFSSLTSSLGPAIGGALIDAFGWRSVFWINVPLAIIVIVLALRHVEETRDPQAPRRLDWFGAALVTLGLGGVTYALLSAHAIGWLGTIALSTLVIHERRASAPLVPPQIFASRTFTAINLATLLLYGALGALFYELPFALIQTHGFTALQAALAMLPMILCLIVLARAGTALAQRIGVRRTLALGPALVACGFGVLALFETQNSYAIAFLPGLLLVGIGMGFTVAPLTSAVLAAADARHAGIASGINTAIARIGGLLAIALAVPIASRAGFPGVAISCAVLAALAAVTDAAGIDDAAIR